MTHLAIDAGLDQFAAMLRDERHKLCRVSAAAKKRDWWVNLHNLGVLLEAVLSTCDSPEECGRVARAILSEPWHWRPEFVCAECRSLDGRKV